MYFKMFTLLDKEYTNKTKLVKSMYKVSKLKKIVETDAEIEFTFSEAAIGEELEKHYDKFTESEIFTILNDETRTLLNMVPSTLEDIIKMDFHSKDYDPFQPLEILAGQCIADYFLHEPEQIKEFCVKAMEEQERTEERKQDDSRPSILDTFIHDFKDDKEKHDEIVQYFTSEEIRREKFTLA